MGNQHPELTVVSRNNRIVRCKCNSKSYLPHLYLILRTGSRDCGMIVLDLVIEDLLKFRMGFLGNFASLSSVIFLIQKNFSEEKSVALSIRCAIKSAWIFDVIFQ